ncbi:MerR family transcriptional regulator [Acetobacteraceae bacterium KSS8]|uniref:MerR family transcriptional regulator n=1 Tax=Endosaccharibacter trunci TaxID=2812733 RepID=A0ABT1W910_9PROT|nr:MerR family transcriptional regulator [Acetobacteraceae bacterium KSS8]
MSDHDEWPSEEGAQDEHHGEDARPEEPSTRLKKSPSAFRTISEVADDLHIPQHVLRFWETRFPQVKPLKRGGGRRYYRPDDIALLRRISDLLYIQGYTIKGVQRLLREGDGTLTGDLPPPDVAERDDEVLFPPKPVFVATPSVAEAAPEPAGPAPELAALESENQRLRGMLRSVLGELEQIREQLPH